MENYEPDRLTEWMVKRFGEKTTLNICLCFCCSSNSFTVGVFIILPTWIVNVFSNFTENEIALNLIEGIVRILMFVIYSCHFQDEGYKDSISIPWG